ncbi:MAG: tRNA 2-thiouridine(34) synthase MnmA [Planctomycetaceae bacterium]|jgi:tRNA-specific 2-thiouridylase|nr:tRNA 2-thiouridine(34) synthase MnmA [Planctomycetaceae bacterium]
MGRVVVAMSGGVDSSAAAWLLKEQGHDVIGLFMRSGVAEQTACELPITGPGSARRQGCCSAADAADARRVADTLDIPFHALDFQDDFERIQDYFADEYLAGRTPNPCVMCNNWLKFGRLWEFARQVGATAIASGHYARLQPTSDPARPALLRGHDPDKDQSYVLFGLEPDLLEHVVFPIGDSTKSEIRATAKRAGIRVFDKPDSQEICFVPDNDYAAFLRRHRGELDTAGELVDTAGTVVGTHDGFERFTIGQRRGLGVAFGEPRYVVAIESRTRRVTIGTHDDLARDWLEADRLNWLAEKAGGEVLRCSAQIRYRHEAATAAVQQLDDDRVRVTFDQPQFGVAPGQAVVFYDDNRVLGGGWIR